MKKHAFLLQVHKQPELFRRILMILSNENHYFFVHVDKKTKNYQEYRNATNDIPNVCFLDNRINVCHGGISQIECTLALLKKSFNYSVSFDFFHSLSGQDYPIRSNQQFDDFFEQTNDSFMAFDPEDKQKLFRKKKYSDRVNLLHFNDNNTLLAKVYRRTSLIRIVSLFKHFPKIEPIYGGWSWFSWNHQTVAYVLNYIDEHPEYYERFNHTYCGDELFFHTILASQIVKLHIEIYRPLRFVSWIPYRTVSTKYRPYTLNELDYHEIISSEAFFCRKVELPESEKLLDMIDKQRGNIFDISEATKINL